MIKISKFLDSIILAIKIRFHNPFFIDSNGSLEDTVILAGVGRGGTTWLSEIINYDNGYRYMFEPLNQERVGVVSNFNKRQYLRPEKDYDYHDNSLKKILSGNVKGYWIDHYNNKLITQKRLVKFVRGNLLLGRIKNLFPEIPIVLLIRHPFSVASSHVKRGWTANFHLLYFNQNELMEDYINPHKEYLSNLKTHFELQIAMWCIDNMIPMNQFRDKEIYVCFYEFLLEKPEEEIKSIFNHINKPFNAQVMNVIKKPSRISSTESTVKNFSNEKLATARIDNLSEKEIEDGTAVLKHFGLEKLYNLETNSPNKVELLKLLNSN